MPPTTIPDTSDTLLAINYFTTTAQPLIVINSSSSVENEEIDGELDISSVCYDSHSTNPVHSRFTHLVMWSFMIPEFVCVLTAMYFIIFKKAVLPKLSVFIHHCIMEIFSSVGLSFYTFFAAPFLPLAVNVLVSMFPLLTPVAFGIFESTKQYRDSFNLIAWMEERAFKSFRRLGKSLGIIIRLASLFCYVLALFLLTVTLSPVYGKESVACPPGGGVLSLVIVICVVLISIPFWINYALVSGSEWLREKSFSLRGFHEEDFKEEEHEEPEHNYAKRNSTQLPKRRVRQKDARTIPPRGYEWAQLGGAVVRIILNYTLYISCTLSSLRGMLNNGLFDCSDTKLFGNNKYYDYDITVLIFILSTVGTSYCYKTSARVNIQSFGLLLPYLLGPSMAYFMSDLGGLDDDTWGTTAKYLPTYGFALVPLILVATHLWSNDYFPYQLERNLFINFGYKPIFTSTLTALNRRLIDIEDECKNVNLRDGDDDTQGFRSKFRDTLRGITSMLGKGVAEDIDDDEAQITGTDFDTRRRNNSGRENIMRHISWYTGQKVPKIFICTTLWHEEDFEMATLVRSVLKLMKAAKEKKEKAENSDKDEDYDYFDLEMHIFFDNVFEKDKKEREQQEEDNPFGETREQPEWSKGYNEWKILNRWVVMFHEQLKKGLRLFHDQKKFNVMNALSTGKVMVTPYGGRIEYDIAGTPMVVHLKDSEKCQRGKRWSQVMYLYYLIGWKIDACSDMSGRSDIEKDKCFILALDGDVDFDPPALDLVLHRLMRNPKVAACCGQIHPTGSGYLVGYQRFEYAVGHWLQKTAEHVLGCVLCSPGCFSLIRVSHLAKPNVMAMYKSLAKTPLQKLQYDQGEDRWLCTLMLTAGGRIEFEASSHCNTFAPEDLETFYKQRRRWGPSTTANVYQMILNQAQARKQNDYISFAYIFYHILMLIFSLIGVSTTLMMVAEAFHITLGYNIGKAWCYAIVVLPVILYAAGCLMSNDQDLQLSMAKWLSLAFSFIMASVLIGIVIEGVNCPIAPSFLFFMALVGINVLAALLHFDPGTLLYGIIYFLFIPSCFIFLQIYSIANLNDVSWGTRQGPKKNNDLEETKGFLGRLFGITQTNVASDDVDGDKPGVGCSCVLCPKITKKEVSEFPPAPIRPTHHVTHQPTVRMSRLSRRSFTTKQETRIRHDSEKIYESDEDCDGGDPAEDQQPEDVFEQAVTTEINNGNVKLFEPLTIECDYGGLTIEELRDTNNLEWTLKMTNLTEDGEYLLAKNQSDHQQPSELKPYKKQYLANREKKYFEKNEIDYLSWVLSDKSPLHQNCKVHILSNPEFDFWTDMVDKDDGYIGIRTEGKNSTEIAATEARVVEELEAFRTEKFMYFLFINALWMIVTSIILLYTDSLISIDIEIPREINQCGVLDDDEEDDTYHVIRFNPFATNNGDHFEVQANNITQNPFVPTFPVTLRTTTAAEEKPRVIKLQPFSVIFLMFYIILILTQFVCMLWHRLSTFYHFVAFIDINKEKETIKAKKDFNRKAEFAAVKGSDDGDDSKDIEENRKSRNSKKSTGRRSSRQSFNQANGRRKSTVAFAGEDISDEEDRQMKLTAISSRRQERRSSIWIGGKRPSWVENPEDIKSALRRGSIFQPENSSVPDDDDDTIYPELEFNQVKPKVQPKTSVARSIRKGSEVSIAAGMHEGPSSIKASSMKKPRKQPLGSLSEMSEIKEEKIHENTDVFKEASAAWGSSENDPGMKNPAFYPAETTSPFVFPPTQKSDPIKFEVDDGESSDKKKKQKPKKPPKVPKRQSPPDLG